MKVYVVTDSEGGWDCVRGVYETLKLAVESLDAEYVGGKPYQYDLAPYMIHEKEYHSTPAEKATDYHISPRQTRINFERNENRD